MYPLSGWSKCVFNSIRKLGKNEFELNELYQFKADFKKDYPLNNNIEQKIQQQVQNLEKEGFLKRYERGRYLVTEKFNSYVAGLN